MVAAAILSVAGMGLAGSFGYISRAIQSQRARTLAINLSQEQVEFLKDKSYFSILPTQTPSYNSAFSPALAYDPTYYPPKAISIGQNKFERLTYVERVLNSSGTLVAVPYDSLDTGLKKITIHTIWKLGNTWYKSTTTNLVSNYSQLTTGGFSGTVTDTAGNAINEAIVFVQEDAFMHDYTDAAGKYAFAVTPGAYTLAASAPGYSRQAPSTQHTISPGNIATVDFVLTPISSGSVSGAVWVNNHILVSSVVSSTLTIVAGGADQDVEYVELFNPTTAAVTIGSGASPDVRLTYLGQVAGDDLANVPLTYVSTYVPAGRYYLIASATSFVVLGQWINADAYYGTLNADVIKRNKSGAIQVTGAGGAILDGVGWSKTAGDVDSGAGSAPWAEGNPSLQISGLRRGDQLVRYSSPAAVGSVYGRAYDSDDNVTSFAFSGQVPPLGELAYPPFNTASPAQTMIAGTPAYGAWVTADDGLSASTSAYRVTTTGGSPYSTFTLVGIATGTWTVTITSGAATLSISQVSVLTSGAATAVPNSGTSPAWPAAAQNSSILTSTTSNGIVSGRVTNPNAVPIAGISVTVEPAASGLTSSQGTYAVAVPAGTYSVIANANSASSPSYGSASLSAVTVSVGQFNGGNNLVLSGAGQVTGYVCNYGVTNAYPGVTVTATDLNDNVRGETVSGSDGKFLFSNLSTGAYTIRTVLDTGQTSSPTDAAAAVTTGNKISIGTFTVTGAYGVISGSVTASGSRITTGVLIVATTGTINASLPPAISTGMLSGAPYYMASTLSDGTFSVDVRAGTASATFNIYGWYTTYSAGAPNTVKKTRAVTVTGGQTAATGLSW